MLLECLDFNLLARCLTSNSSTVLCRRSIFCNYQFDIFCFHAVDNIVGQPRHIMTIGKNLELIVFVFCFCFLIPVFSVATNDFPSCLAEATGVEKPHISQTYDTNGLGFLAYGFVTHSYYKLIYKKASWTILIPQCITALYKKSSYNCREIRKVSAKVIHSRSW